jgi:hypothetical protein
MPNKPEKEIHPFDQANQAPFYFKHPGIKGAKVMIFYKIYFYL